MFKNTRENGITLVSLIVTIIVLIILAGVSINLVLGDNGIITIAKRAKENIELAKIEEETELNELYTQLETGDSGSENLPYDSIAKLTEFKIAIANAIDEAGGIKPDISAETAIFVNNIKGILKEVTKNATATENDILNNKTAYKDGKMITGTIQNYNGKIVTASEVTSEGDNVYISIPSNGYYTTDSKITVNTSMSNEKFLASYIKASQAAAHYVVPTYVNENLATVNDTEITIKKSGTLNYVISTCGNIATTSPYTTSLTFNAILYVNGTKVISNTKKTQYSSKTGTIDVQSGDVLKFYNNSSASWGSTFNALLYFE